ncbi:hypothetical protein M670_00116 [Schinkia azotoformans MEV2011]|uniref:Uncharacterized protein n=1 Tax=Schinkia azotoformans MEV2011 TaxID=1348973 RepID=A0A072NRQ3_SCHAZ|nr:hypothetical protein [Schinkia azotoformans]KEF40101.1 hypothetical protein M670_00116 [Schinkia azotoformans MEV2011]
MYEVIGQLRCPVCRETVKMDDKVILDIFNTIVHVKCYYDSSHPFEVKDRGRFHKMILKYDYFKDSPC